MQRWCFSMVLLLLTASTANAQEDDVPPFRNPNVNIHVDVDTTRTIPTYGENRRWFINQTYGLYTRFGPNETGAKTLGRSIMFDYGINTKLKLWSWDALCLNVNVGQERWAMAQDSQKIVPDTLLHKTERFQFNRLQGEFYNRINLDRHRGNIIGTYLEFGVYGNWMYHNLHITRDSSDATTTTGPKLLKVRETKLPYINPLQYGFVARFGSEYFALSATWRVSDYFKSNETFAYPELPRLWFGFVLSAY